MIMAHAQEVINTLKKLLLIPITIHPRLGENLNRNCLVNMPDHFSSQYKKVRETTPYTHRYIYTYNKQD